MELKNYLERKPQFFIVFGLSFILASCSSTRNLNSNNDVKDIAQKTDYQSLFDNKVKEYETSINYDDLYFTDLNTYRANYFTSRSLFGAYQYSGLGNRFNNVSIDNTGINIYSNTTSTNIGRTNWTWTIGQLESWGWMNKGWTTPWNQKGWRSVSNSWNGPIWNYWGWDGDLRTLLLMEQNKLQTRYAINNRYGEYLGKRLSVYQNKTNNKVYRSKTRTRPITKKQSIKSDSYVYNNLTTNDRSTSKSTTRINQNTIKKNTVRKSSNTTNNLGNLNSVNNSKKTLRN